jgi:hypothetical protein
MNPCSWVQIILFAGKIVASSSEWLHFSCSLFGAQAFAGVVFAVNVAPPPIAVFDQPPCPGDGYIWLSGYYQYGDYG